MNENNHDEEEQEFPDLFRPGENVPFYIICYIVIFGSSAVVGSVGNIMVIATILVDKKLRKVKNGFIISLAAADFWVSAITMPASIAGVLVGRLWYENHHFVCAFTSAVCAPACIASVYSIAFIAAHRYFYIGRYALSLKYFNVKHVIGFVIFIWSLGFIIHVPNHIGWGTTRYSFMLRFCSIDTDLHSYGIFYAGLVVLALVVTFIFYVKIYRVLCQTTLAKKMITGGTAPRRLAELEQPGVNPNSKRHNDLREETKIIKVSFRIYLVFFITWLPLTVLILSHLGDRVPPCVYLLAGLLAHCNSTLNFIFYFLCDGTFKTALKRFWFKIFPFTGGKIHDLKTVAAVQKINNEVSRRTHSVVPLF